VWQLFGVLAKELRAKFKGPEAAVEEVVALHACMHTCMRAQTHSSTPARRPAGRHACNITHSRAIANESVAPVLLG
jgi:hypothetical protein